MMMNIKDDSRLRSDNRGASIVGTVSAFKFLSIIYGFHGTSQQQILCVIPSDLLFMSIKTSKYKKIYTDRIWTENILETSDDKKLNALLDYPSNQKEKPI